MTRLSTLVEDLRGFVLDERRVVTYRWLAITLSISFDAAKRLLYAFTQETKEKGKPPLIVTYFVSGQKKCDAGGDELPMEIASLVPENLLEETKKKLYKVTSVHEYSVALAEPYAGNATGISYVDDLWTIDAEHDREITFDTNAGRMLRCGSIKCNEVKFEEPKAFTRPVPGIHESIGRKTCTNVSRMNGPSNHTATIISNGKKNRKIKTKSNLKAINPSNFFAECNSNAGSKDRKKNPEGRMKVDEEGTKYTVPKNGEVENVVNTNPVPASRLNLFKVKKGGAIDQFIKPRDDFDFPESNPLGQEDPDIGNEFGIKNEPIDNLKPADPEEDQFEGGETIDPPVQVNHHLQPPIAKLDSEAQKQSSRTNRYTGKDITDCDDLKDTGHDEMESSNVQECTQKKQCDMNDHVLGSSSNTSKIKRKKQKIQTRTFMDSDGYMQHIEEMVEVSDEEFEADDTRGGTVSHSDSKLSKTTASVPLVAKEGMHTLSGKKRASEIVSAKDRGKTSTKRQGKKSAKQLGIGRFFGK